MQSVQEEAFSVKTKCFAHKLLECIRTYQLHGLVVHVEQPVRHGSEESRESEALKCMLLVHLTYGKTSALNPGLSNINCD